MKANNNALSSLWTAEKANESALYGMWHDWSIPPIWDIENDRKESDDEDGHFIECTVPDAESAKAYVEARHIRECFFGGKPDLVDRKYTSEEAKAYCKIESKYRKMHLDMRDQIIMGDNGKKGLRDVCGKVLVEPQFDDFPERYSCFERINLIPVVLDTRYYLFDIKKQKLLTKGYDRIFRYFWSSIDYFVAEENGKKGILTGTNGKECTPIIMEEIYEMPDPDGAVPFVKDGKIGFVWCDTYVEPVFDDVRFCSEDHTRVKLDGVWGWIDSQGKFTGVKLEASFGSWYDGAE